MPKRSISITETHNEWLKAQVASGQYRSESEVISDLIREQQQRDAGIEAIRLAMVEDEKCGPGTPTPEDVRTAVQERLRKKRLVANVGADLRVRPAPCRFKIW